MSFLKHLPSKSKFLAAKELGKEELAAEKRLMDAVEKWMCELPISAESRDQSEAREILTFDSLNPSLFQDDHCVVIRIFNKCALVIPDQPRHPSAPSP